MQRIVFNKEPGAENFLRNQALNVIRAADNCTDVRIIERVLLANAGFSTQDAVEFSAWIETFLTLIQCTLINKNL